MKLHELAEPQPSKQISKVFESYFGTKIQFDSLNARQTQHLLQRVRGLLSEHRSGPARHHSEQNPSYLKLVMMEQALVAQQQQQAAAPGAAAPAAAAPGAAPAAGANPAQAAALATAQQQQKKKQIQDQIKQKQKEIADLQKAMNNPAMAENRQRRIGKLVFESEVQQAQVVLAAQDMVDKMQGMLEDVSELQFKELPALVDSIKNQVGIDQAQQFNTDATAALTGLLQNIQGAKQQLDAALGVVTGQAPAAGAADMAAGAGMDAAGAADMGAGAVDDLGAVGDDLDAAAADAEEPEAGIGAALGRAKR
jgi:hypothetical protein